MVVDKSFYLTLYWAYDYLSMLRIKLINANKLGPMKQTINNDLLYATILYPGLSGYL